MNQIKTIDGHLNAADLKFAILATRFNDFIVDRLIRGGTPHFDFVAAEATKGLAHVSLESGVPVGFGLLTTDNIEQAIERAGTKAGNKGVEAASAVLETVRVLQQI